ncbi:hypothetical protein J2X41_001852 [Caulobacter sp. BE254]|nr:hypothetical protein [Caulobacter sp. BE254]
MADTAHDTEPLRQTVADKDAVIGGVGHDEPGGQSLDQDADFERVAAMSGGQDGADRLTRPARSMEGRRDPELAAADRCVPSPHPALVQVEPRPQVGEGVAIQAPRAADRSAEAHDTRTHVGDGLQQGRAGPWTPRLRLEPDLDPGPSWTTTRSRRRLSATASSRACLRRVFSLAASPLKHRAEKWAPVFRKSDAKTKV